MSATIIGAEQFAAPILRAMQRARMETERNRASEVMLATLHDIHESLSRVNDETVAIQKLRAQIALAIMQAEQAGITPCVEGKPNVRTSQSSAETAR